MKKRLQIQGDSAGKDNILVTDSIGSCEKEVYMKMCLILSAYRSIATKITGLNSVRFLCMRLVEERSLQKKGGYKRRTARSQFGCCCPRKET
jgi:hypothetical protein